MNESVESHRSCSQSDLRRFTLPLLLLGTFAIVSTCVSATTFSNGEGISLANNVKIRDLKKTKKKKKAGKETAPPTPQPTPQLTPQPTPAPTPAPTPQPTPPSIPSPTPAPVSSTTNSALTYLGDCSSSSPCGLCEGDCDDSTECDPGLVCFERHGYEDVPGCSGEGISGKDYCYNAPPNALNYIGDCSSSSPCGNCQGDCDGNSQCASGLTCFERDGLEPVPGCVGGAGVSAKDYCYNAQSAPSPTPAPVSSTTNAVLVHLGDCSSSAPCNQCEGDCDGSSQCAQGLECYERSGMEPVPGCSGNGVSGKDYCAVPPPNVLFHIGDCSSSSPCSRCFGDCDSDSQCAPGLLCYFRDGQEAVPGCSGLGISGKDYCYGTEEEVEFPDSLTYVGVCSSTSLCGKCEGSCVTTNDCEAGIVCFQRTSTEPVPGCVTGGSGDVSGAGYCHEPGFSDATYIPGDLTVSQNGLLLSTGLSSRIIATKGDKVSYTGSSGESTVDFHSAPDGGAVFNTSGGGWIYVSNSESSSNGGVGAITFDNNGEVINYEMIATGTRRNCGGGKTWWDTWITCEEDSGGQVWETDPFGNNPKRETLLGGTGGGEFESFAYDNRNIFNPTFYVTEDKSTGSLRKFTPDIAAVQSAVSSGIYTNLLHDNSGGTAKLEYLVVSPDPTDSSIGTFAWSLNKATADANAGQYYQNSEGIDIRDGKLYMTCKSPKLLYILDLDAKTYEVSSTVSGAFNNQPDQIASIIGGGADDMLYFCEDGGSDSGVHGRDSEGNFYTILDGPAYSSETTGLAFSRDNMHMYVSFQSPGIIFDIKRTDGYPFGGQRLDIKYHAA